ncbi:hypothetical protein HDV00_011688 [Rhizophlyctis rosea]|nr:hypothetical protein HDV00_011688 [Rhizophlyctis rosea]
MFHSSRITSLPITRYNFRFARPIDVGKPIVPILRLPIQQRFFLQYPPQTKQKNSRTQIPTKPQPKFQIYRHWAAAEDKKLLQFRNKGLSFRTIGDQLQRPGSSCRRRYDALIHPPKRRGFWSEEEDIILIDASDGAQASEGNSWQYEVAKQTGRTIVSVRSRLRYLTTNLQRGPLTPEQLDFVENEINRAIGQNTTVPWTYVGKQVDRLASDILNLWRRRLAGVKKGPYGEDEDAVIARFVEDADAAGVQPHWVQIAGYLNRNPNDVRTHWMIMLELHRKPKASQSSLTTIRPSKANQAPAKPDGQDEQGEREVGQTAVGHWSDLLKGGPNGKRIKREVLKKGQQVVSSKEQTERDKTQVQPQQEGWELQKGGNESKTPEMQHGEEVKTAKTKVKPTPLTVALGKCLKLIVYTVALPISGAMVVASVFCVALLAIEILFPF